jgi:ATP-dependent Lhr-like helicase
MMDAYDMLSEPVRRYIRDQRWEKLRPIQTAAIKRIAGSTDHFILASRTASGKTEAAFLPILSLVDFKQAGIQVLYISPLIALINDQFQRVEALSRYLDVRVTKWHGEANKTDKKKLLETPEGILLITPESIESLFVNHPHKAYILLSHLKFIVIDEIHTFLGSDRGLQLKSLLSRISGIAKEAAPRIVGLSATIGDYEEAKRFTGSPEHTKVLLDATSKDVDAYFRYIPNDTAAFTISFIEALYENIKDSKVLIFPNSRGKAEELAVMLKKTADRKKGNSFYFSHHSSVDKELREYIEDFAKTNKRQNFCIACTSTLELGIDIGSVDMVVQVDSASSIASLIQRVGRSGRKEGAKSNLLLYATNKWDLLQSIACWELYKSGFVEPVYNQEKPYDLLFHQTLSILKETCGIAPSLLLDKLKKNVAFRSFDESEIAAILSYMIKADYIEDLKRDLIVGYEGEKLTNTREFYSMFTTAEMFKVIHAGNKIGEIDVSPMVIIDANILLAAKIWKIKDIDHETKKILVIPTNDGKRPAYFGEGADVHPKIREKMLELIYSEINIEQIDKTAVDCLQELNFDFKEFVIEDLLHDRPVILKGKNIELYTFTGSKIDRTIRFLLRTAGIEAILKGVSIDIYLPADQLIPTLQKQLELLPQNISEMMDDNPASFPLSKWGQYLPLEMQKQYVLKNEFDVKGTREFVDGLRMVYSSAIATPEKLQEEL